MYGYELGNNELGKSLEKLKQDLEEQHQAIQLIKNDYNEAIDSINNKKETSLLELQVTQEQVKELENLIDTNGKVKEGYEDRVSYILGDLNKALGTEYELTGNQISQNGKLYKSYDELKANIDTYIAKRKQQIEAEAYEEVYKETLKERIKLEEQMKSVSENRYEAEQKLKEALNEVASATTIVEQETARRNKSAAEFNLRNAIQEEKNLQTELDNTNTKLNEAESKFTDTYKSMNDTATTQGNNLNKAIWQQFNEQNQIVEDKENEIITTYEEKGLEAKNRYGANISKIKDDTRESLNENINTISSLSPNEIQKWADLAKNSKEEYEKKLSGLDSTTSQRIQSCVDAINNKKWTAEQTAQGLADAVERGVNTIDTTYAGQQAVAGVATGINRNKNSSSLWNAISGVVSNVKNWFNNMLGIHSPSRVFADLASYIPSGIAKGITDNIDDTTKPIKELTNNITDTFSNNIDIPNISKELNKGIKINPKDFEVDTNQYINYSAIKGQILTQSQVNINDSIAKKIAEAVTQSMRNAEVNVNIEAKTEEGVIVKKIVNANREYKMQTGEPLLGY